MRAPSTNPASINLARIKPVFRAVLLISFALTVGVIIHPVLAALIGVAALLGRYWNLDVAIIIFLASTLLIPSTMSWNFGLADFGPSRVTLILFMLTWLYYWKERKVSLKKTPLDLPIFLLTCAMLLSFTINSPSMNGSQFNQAVKTLGVSTIEWFFLFYLVASIKCSWNRTERIIKYILAFSVTISLLGLIEYFTGFKLFEEMLKYLPRPVHTTNAALQATGESILRGNINRITSTMISPHEVGLIMSMTLPFALYFLAYSMSLLRRCAWAMISAILAITLALTVTRGAFLAVFVVVCIFAVLARHWMMRTSFYFLLVLTLLVFIVMPNLRHTFVILAQSGMTGSDSSTHARVEDWSQAAELLAGREFTGIGLGQVLGHQLNYGEEVSRSFFFTDNYYLATTVELGVIGIISLVMVWLAVVGSLSRGPALDGAEGWQRRDLRLAFLAAALAFMLMCLTFDALAFSTVAKFFWFMLGLAVSFTRNERALGALADSGFIYHI